MKEEKHDDIKVCDGRGCPYKLHCWRFLKPRGEMEEYFDEPPFRIWNLMDTPNTSSTAKGFHCDYILKPEGR